ncbi:MAG TPA: histidine kinase dimerization/phospho-acceptor domain-containing protein [Lysobacter sp.]|nr:histidine kinase dimerization/phospho-acceptor domain-containing protein [Lysobacter sp.]
MAASDWSRRVVHDLRNPASTLRTAAYLLRRGLNDPNEEQRLLEVLERQSTQLLAMLDELAHAFWAERGDPLAREEAVDLVELSPPADTGAAAFEARSLLPVRGDPARLAQLLRLLCALRLGEETQPAPLVAELAGDRVRLHRRLRALPELCDAPQTLLQRALPQPLGEGGLGLQLPIAAAIAAAHGGELRIERAGDDALAVTVELPARR